MNYNDEPYEIKKSPLLIAGITYAYPCIFLYETLTFFAVVSHNPRAGLVTKLLYESTLRSLWMVRCVVPNSSTSSRVVTVPFFRINKYRAFTRFNILSVEGLKKPLLVI